MAATWHPRVWVAATLCLMPVACAAQGPISKDAGDPVKPAVVLKDATEDPKKAKLMADTRRMLALSREVQAAMAKSGPDTLSLDVVKKVEELQKLAAVVKAEIGRLP